MKISRIFTFLRSGIPGNRKMHKPLWITRPNLCFGARNHFFHEIQLFRWNFTFRRKTICARKSSSERKTGIRRRGHMRKSWFRLTICALKGNQIKCDGHFYNFCLPKWWDLVKIDFFGEFHQIPWKWVKFGENGTFSLIFDFRAPRAENTYEKPLVLTVFEHGAPPRGRFSLFCDFHENS